MLIVLEGLDGAGKSTQVKKLREYLTARCGELDYIHFPRYESAVYGDLISRFLRGEFGPNDAVHPQLVALLFAEDRHAAADEIKAKLAEGKMVLLDRRLRKWIFDVEYGAFGEPVPDLNIFLDVPITFVEKNLASSREGDDRSYLVGAQDIHEASIAFQSRVRQMYLRQAELDPSFKVLGCSDESGAMESPDVIFASLKKMVDEAIDR